MLTATNAANRTGAAPHIINGGAVKPYIRTKPYKKRGPYKKKKIM